ncbi:hypothetical protein AADZ90_006115 [Aestuariibius sp. 2305UL40-4]|uniref:hypothetical protein n=1 Tax=Aestuariibius violaceus TaxID=3234132 RepID=UPI00345E431F
MITRLAGAVLRAVLVVALVLAPSLLLDGTSADAAQIAALVALFAAVMTLVEYGSDAPSFVEFRDAPPYNRIRFIAILATAMLLIAVLQTPSDGAVVHRFVSILGRTIADAADFPYSPVRLVVVAMPSDLSPALISQVRTAAGLSYVISILSLLIFVALMLAHRWPSRKRAFNVWVNLPMFDPSTGDDVVIRLYRDARFNLIAGFLLPFILPALVKLFTVVSNEDLTGYLSHTQTLIWLTVAWAFLPASLLMRGIALAKVAMIIEGKRRKTYERAERDGYLASS